MTESSLALRDEGHIAAPHAHSPVLDFAGGTLRDKWQMAELLAQSSLVPKDFRGKPGDILIVADMAASVGMTVGQGLQSIAVINGRPSMWGDGLKGVAYRSPLCEWIKEVEIAVCKNCSTSIHRESAGAWTHDTSGVTACAVPRGAAQSVADKGDEDSYGYRCSAKRRGDSNVVANEFTFGDAKRAKLLDKDGPWKTYGPRRMCRMRARSWTLRDAFPDVLKGLAMREEVVDIPEDVREAIVGAPTRTDALKNALSIRQAVATATAVPEQSDPPNEAPGTTFLTEDELRAALDTAAATDPDFAKMPGLEIKNHVSAEAEKVGLKPWDLATIIKQTEQGRLLRQNTVAVLRTVRERALREKHVVRAAVAVEPVEPPNQPVLDEIPLDEDHVGETIEHDQTPAVPDFGAMTGEQLLDHVTDRAFSVQISEPALNIILRAHAEGGLSAANIGDVLVEIDKRAAKKE